MTATATAIATSAIVIPTKSTISEEDIEISFGCESASGPSTITDDRDCNCWTGTTMMENEPETAGFNSPSSVGLAVSWHV
jgi:hypothetical protein